MSQDVYLGRRTVDSQAALALEAALSGLPSGRQKQWQTMANGEVSDQ
jgi:hypothetical protein